MTAIKKHLSLLLITLLLLVAAIHKLNGEIPPNWFIVKFQDTIISKVPFGLEASYWIIMLLELFVPAVFALSWLQMARRKNYQLPLSIGFLGCYVLFVALTFGSFLVQDYENGFMDFTYFVGIMLIEFCFFKEDTKTFGKNSY